MVSYVANRWQWYTRKVNTGECLRLSCSDLYQRKAFPIDEDRAPKTLTLTWWRGQKKEGSISVLVYQDDSTAGNHRLELLYHANAKLVSSAIYLDKTDRPRRYWFLCPDCNRRMGALYLPYNHSLFKCRHCHDLAYASAQNARKLPKSLEGFKEIFKQMEKEAKWWAQFEKRKSRK